MIEGPLSLDEVMEAVWVRVGALDNLSPHQ